MKTLLIILFSLLINCGFSQGIGINENGNGSDPSAILDINSTNKGFLPPRMNTSERDLIQNPAKGLMIYNLDFDCIQFNKGTSSNPNWICTDGTYASNPPFICGDQISFIYRGQPVTYGTVLGENNRCWLDRNLGAQAVASSFNDSQAFGDLFQWGRSDDGHQDRFSAVTSVLSSSAIVGHTDFIAAPNSPNDWLTPSNSGLWQGVNGTNNPCPNGWRIPSESEWNTEISGWSTLDRVGAFESNLKLTSGGMRYFNGNINYYVGTEGWYWVSTIHSSTTSKRFSFNTSNAWVGNYYRANGQSVRCIKD